MNDEEEVYWLSKEQYARLNEIAAASPAHIGVSILATINLSQRLYRTSVQSGGAMIRVGPDDDMGSLHAVIEELREVVASLRGQLENER